VKSKLNIFVNQLKAGELWLDHQRRFCFQYDKSWINSPDSYRLSVSLPLREDPYLTDDSYSFGQHHAESFVLNCPMKIFYWGL